MPTSKEGSVWRVEFMPAAERDLKKLGSADRLRVQKFLRTRIEGTDRPRQFGGPLVGLKAQLWRYRVGDIRIICKLEYERVVVLVLEIGNRREIYR